jgi:multicomponent Na+:H+ antiporter subunit C
MTVAVAYGLTGVALFVTGLCGAILCRHVLRKVMAVNVMGSGVFLLLVSGAHRVPDGPDPVPHAMVLTGIVVAVSATALALALAQRAAAVDRGESAPGAGPAPQ